MLFVYYPKCSTCKKAKQILDNRNLDYIEKDIKLDNPNYHEIESWYQKSNLPLRKFFNTSGIVYKELNLKEKIGDMTEKEMINLLSTNGMLIKRPILVTKNSVIIGFKKDIYENI